MKKIKQETLIYIITFLILSIVVHTDKWFSTPMEHLSALSTHPIPFHPFLYVFLAYLLIYIIRVILKFTKKLVIK